MTPDQRKSLLATLSTKDYASALAALEAGAATSDPAAGAFKALGKLLRAPGVKITRRLSIPGGEATANGFMVPQRDGGWPIITAEIPGGGAPYLGEQIIRSNAYIVPLHLDERGQFAGAATAVTLLRAMGAYNKQSGWKPQQAQQFVFTSSDRALEAYLQKPRPLGTPTFSGMTLELQTGEKTSLTADSAQFGDRSFVTEMLLEKLGRLEIAETKGAAASLAMPPFKLPFSRLAGTVGENTPAIRALLKGLVNTIDLLGDMRELKQAKAFLRPRLKAAAEAMKADPKTAATTYAKLTAVLKGFEMLLHRGPWWPSTTATIKRLRKQGYLVDNIYYNRAAYTVWIRKELAKLQPLLPQTQKPKRKAPADSPLTRKAKTFVPKQTFAGMLALEDAAANKKNAATLKSLGVKTSDALPEWMQCAVALAAGKKTVLDIHPQLQAAGFRVPLQKLMDFYALLEKCGKMRRRPILSEQRILKALREAGVKKGDVIMAHVGFTAYGYIPAGPMGLIEVFRKAVGPEGTVCMPTHAGGCVGNVPFDRENSPAGTGLVPTLFNRVPGAIRGTQPTHSASACGPLAEYLTDGSRPEIPVFGEGSFWDRFEKAGGKIVMFTNGLGSNTFLHGVDYRGGATFPDQPCHIIENGKRREVIAKAPPFHVDSFPALYEAFEKKGLVHRAPLGEGTVYVMTAAELSKVGLPIIRKNPVIATRPNCPCDYCKHIRRVINRRKKKK